MAETRIRDYELVMVVTPEATEEKLAARLESVSEFVKKHGGTVDSLDRWGKKKLAYPVKHLLEGSYFLYHLKLPTAASRELEANLRISEDVLRHMLVKLDE